MNYLQESNISKASKNLKDAVKYDDSLDELHKSLIDCDSIVSDCIKELDKKIDTYDIDEKEFSQMENRLELIRSILAKYNNSFDEMTVEYEKKKDAKYLNSVISKTIGIGSGNDLILKKIKNEIEPGQIIIITGIGESYGIVRGHTILNNLHSIITNNPLIMLYP